MRCILGGIFGAILGLGCAIPSAQALEPATQFELDYIVRPWDRWSLLDHRPANRYLWRQHDASRVFEPTARLAFLSDVLVGTQMPRPGTTLGAWHGHAIADTYFGVRAHDNLDVNLNLVAFNMSASQGYRANTAVSPGIAAHLHGAVGDLRGDLVTLDLGQVTLGQGLMFEQLPLEGAMGRLRWNEWWVRLLIGGQLHQYADDLFAVTAGWRDLQVSWYGWSHDSFDRVPQWVTVSGEIPGLPEGLRVGVEGLSRVDGNALGRTAAMARVDWMPALSGPTMLHLGYQYRWYAHGYGPHGKGLQRMFTRPAFIWREDTYVTNGYEAYWPSGLFDQHWHTLMAEAEIPLGSPWIVGRVEGELWGRLFRDSDGPQDTLVTLDTDGERPHWWPDPDLRFYHRIGIELRPLPGRPDRLRVWVINKVAAASRSPTEPTRTRFSGRRPLLAFELEIFL